MRVPISPHGCHRSQTDSRGFTGLLRARTTPKRRQVGGGHAQNLSLVSGAPLPTPGVGGCRQPPASSSVGSCPASPHRSSPSPCPPWRRKTGEAEPILWPCPHGDEPCRLGICQRSSAASQRGLEVLGHGFHEELLAAGWALKGQDGNVGVPSSQGCLVVLVPANAINRPGGIGLASGKLTGQGVPWARHRRDPSTQPKRTQDGPRQPFGAGSLGPSCESNGASELRGTSSHASITAPTVFKVKTRIRISTRRNPTMPTSKAHTTSEALAQVLPDASPLPWRGAGWRRQDLGWGGAHTHEFLSRLR